MNSPPLFCLDTHAVYWRRTAIPRLSAAAAQVFEDAIHGHAILIVPYIDFLEKAVDGDGKGQSTILEIK